MSAPPLLNREVLQHFTTGDEAAATGFFDLEGAQQPATEVALNFFDGAGGSA